MAATSPETPVFSSAPSSQSAIDPRAAQAVETFYAARGGSPVWLRAGADSNAARELVGVLQRATLDGLSSGPRFAAQAQAMLARAQSGNVADVVAADRFLSTALVAYVSALQTPPAGMTYADARAMPRRDSAARILADAAAAPSLANYVRKISDVNPLYAQL
ncbi:MAG: hypothetical protein ABIS09_03845, partial [Sphingomicrobium sp.]